MRISDPIKRVGTFWLPGLAESRVSGDITISDSGRVDLVIYSNFPSVDSVRIGRIIGDVEGFGFVTLEGCFYKSLNTNFYNSPARSQLVVGRMFCGVGFEEGPICSTKFVFSVEGLDEWVNISGIKVARSGSGKRGAIISYEEVPDIVLELREGLGLRLSFWWSEPGAPILREAKITQKIHFELESETLLEASEFISLGHKITTFICMATDKVVSIEDPFFYHWENRGQSSERSHKVKVFYRSLPFATEQPDVHWFETIFNYKSISESFELYLKAWLNNFDSIGPSIDLYFSARMGVYRYLDGKFLALAQALESLHRRRFDRKKLPKEVFRKMKKDILKACPEEHKDWLRDKLAYGNEISLKDRLAELVAPFNVLFGESKEDNEFISSIVDTRNYLTHFDESGKKNIARGPDLAVLVNKMEVLLQLHLLLATGFSSEDLLQRIKSNPLVQGKLYSTLEDI
ncbi:HEPN domain-containing protein [uncultured Pseudomonas sp.]|uniref:ApeA N-terminal domain 1-containing protein n=1 Tax=uncultured Pseudomonas sp. TaxID=114707 RepID=UPI002589DC9B|nr:HEPN domain-containing protein [uncultured Pseudomonas sp.]